VYAGVEPDTTLADLRARYRLEEVPIPPRQLVVLRARLRAVLDLTPAGVRRLLGLSDEDVRGLGWRRPGGGETPCQAVGRMARARGREGLLVPSPACRAGVGRLLVVFPEWLRAGSFLRVVCAEPVTP
jgi:hypothetical protein